MARGDHQMRVRLPDELLQALTKAADENRRSINAEIVARLEFSFVNDSFQRAPGIPEALRRIADGINRVMDGEGDELRIIIKKDELEPPGSSHSSEPPTPEPDMEKPRRRRPSL